MEIGSDTVERKEVQDKISGEEAAEELVVMVVDQPLGRLVDFLDWIDGGLG